MTREVCFCVNCTDTQIGQHIRVVGSLPSLGSWNLSQSLQLATTAGDFPLWRSSTLVAVEEDAHVEYKYDLDNEGKIIRWEERANRSLNLATAASQGVCPTRGPVAVIENFSCNIALRFCGVERESSPASEHPPAGDASDGKDMLKSTLPEKCLSSEGVSGSNFLRGRWLPQLLPRRPFGLRRWLRRYCCCRCPRGRRRPPSESPLTRRGPGLTVVRFSRGPASSCEFEQKYTLVGHGPLGEGTFGLVWRCIPKGVGVESTRPERAAKIVKKAMLQPRDMRHLLGDGGEVSTHLTMKHPNITELLEYFDEAQSVTLVLELCRGGDLFDAILQAKKATGRGLPEQAAAVATSHVLSALAYMHRQSVVHRDIKCENVLLAHRGGGPSGVALEQNIYKLCDFGFAVHDNGEGFSERLGSPGTVAPEVVAGTRCSFPTDLWSTGVLVYMMLSATPPFYAPTDQDTLRKVRDGSYSLAGALWDSISA
eukprot:CAMPEP_0115736186 /NCGR_PEP_ID=MMETSP0272-20121206/87119_1 /TAXON_ID=71861 /ORGANISM="Scrippsiella trochoidea, Strain CCMP3099" /LENGTH=481 /DNA_ID=CAMNT_0003180343 /DNA_START=41 /DNA_END=1484 /DNA_ORIENTATION=+